MNNYSEAIDMTSLAFTGSLAYIILCCSLLYALRSYIYHLKFNHAKNDIALLNAKIIALRMALRVRVKIKLSSFRERFGKWIDSGIEIDKALNEMSSAKYESGEDFQKYFDLSRHIITMMKNDIRFSAQFNRASEHPDQIDSATESSKLFYEFCGPDYKNEIALVRVIKEITDTHNKLSKKIAEFNLQHKNRKKFVPLPPVLPIQFDFMTEINTIFKNSDILLSDLKNKKSDSFTSAA